MEVKKHIVKAGENLDSVAKQYNLKTGDLARWNAILDNNSIKEGQELNLAWTSELPLQIKVGKDNKLEAYAKQFNVSVDRLKKINNLDTDDVSAGTILTIYNPARNEWLEAKPDDTLDTIAKRYDITKERLIELNPRFTWKELKAGDYVMLPREGIYQYKEPEVPKIEKAKTKIPSLPSYSIPKTTKTEELIYPKYKETKEFMPFKTQQPIDTATSVALGWIPLLGDRLKDFNTQKFLEDITNELKEKTDTYLSNYKKAVKAGDKQEQYRQTQIYKNTVKEYERLTGITPKTTDFEKVLKDLRDPVKVARNKQTWNAASEYEQGELITKTEVPLPEGGTMHVVPAKDLGITDEVSAFQYEKDAVNEYNSYMQEGIDSGYIDKEGKQTSQILSLLERLSLKSQTASTLSQVMPALNSDITTFYKDFSNIFESTDNNVRIERQKRFLNKYKDLSVVRDMYPQFLEYNNLFLESNNLEKKITDISSELQSIKNYREIMTILSSPNITAEDIRDVDIKQSDLIRVGNLMDSLSNYKTKLMAITDRTVTMSSDFENSLNNFQGIISNYEDQNNLKRLFIEGASTESSLARNIKTLALAKLDAGIMRGDSYQDNQDIVNYNNYLRWSDNVTKSQIKLLQANYLANGFRRISEMKFEEREQKKLAGSWIMNWFDPEYSEFNPLEKALTLLGTSINNLTNSDKAHEKAVGYTAIGLLEGLNWASSVVVAGVKVPAVYYDIVSNFGLDKTTNALRELVGDITPETRIALDKASDIAIENHIRSQFNIKSASDLWNPLGVASQLYTGNVLKTPDGVKYKEVLLNKDVNLFALFSEKTSEMTRYLQLEAMNPDKDLSNLKSGDVIKMPETEEGYFLPGQRWAQGLLDPITYLEWQIRNPVGLELSNQLFENILDPLNFITPAGLFGKLGRGVEGITITPYSFTRNTILDLNKKMLVDFETNSFFRNKLKWYKDSFTRWNAKVEAWALDKFPEIDKAKGVLSDIERKNVAARDAFIKKYSKPDSMVTLHKTKDFFDLMFGEKGFLTKSRSLKFRDEFKINELAIGKSRNNFLFNLINNDKNNVTRVNSRVFNEVKDGSYIIVITKDGVRHVGEVINVTPTEKVVKVKDTITKEEVDGNGIIKLAQDTDDGRTIKELKSEDIVSIDEVIKDELDDIDFIWKDSNVDKTTKAFKAKQTWNWLVNKGDRIKDWFTLGVSLEKMPFWMRGTINDFIDKAGFSAIQKAFLKSEELYSYFGKLYDDINYEPLKRKEWSIKDNEYKTLDWNQYLDEKGEVQLKTSVTKEEVIKNKIKSLIVSPHTATDADWDALKKFDIYPADLKDAINKLFIRIARGDDVSKLIIERNDILSELVGIIDPNTVHEKALRNAGMFSIEKEKLLKHLPNDLKEKVINCSEEYHKLIANREFDEITKNYAVAELISRGYSTEIINEAEKVIHLYDKFIHQMREKALSIKDVITIHISNAIDIRLDDTVKELNLELIDEKVIPRHLQVVIDDKVVMEFEPGTQKTEIIEYLGRLNFNQKKGTVNSEEILDGNDTVDLLRKLYKEKINSKGSSDIASLFEEFRLLSENEKIVGDELLDRFIAYIETYRSLLSSDINNFSELLAISNKLIESQKTNAKNDFRNRVLNKLNNTTKGGAGVFGDIKNIDENLAKDLYRVTELDDIGLEHLTNSLIKKFNNKKYLKVKEHNKILVLDIETTGLDVGKDRMLSIGWSIIDKDGNIIKDSTKSYLIKPDEDTREIVTSGAADAALAKNGLSLDKLDVEGNPDLSTVLKELNNDIKDCEAVMGHNLKEFDLQVLRNEYSKAEMKNNFENKDVLDTLHIINPAKAKGKKSLEELYRAYIRDDYVETHDSKQDVLDLIDLYKRAKETGDLSKSVTSEVSNTIRNNVSKLSLVVRSLDIEGGLPVGNIGHYAATTSKKNIEEIRKVKADNLFTQVQEFLSQDIVSVVKELNRSRKMMSDIFNKQKHYKKRDSLKNFPNSDVSLKDLMYEKTSIIREKKAELDELNEGLKVAKPNDKEALGLKIKQLKEELNKLLDERVESKLFKESDGIVSVPMNYGTTAEEVAKLKELYDQGNRFIVLVPYAFRRFQGVRIPAIDALNTIGAVEEFSMSKKGGKAYDFYVADIKNNLLMPGDYAELDKVLASMAEADIKKLDLLTKAYVLARPSKRTALIKIYRAYFEDLKALRARGVLDTSDNKLKAYNKIIGKLENDAEDFFGVNADEIVGEHRLLQNLEDADEMIMRITDKDNINKDSYALDLKKLAMLQDIEEVFNINELYSLSDILEVKNKTDVHSALTLLNEVVTSNDEAKLEMLHNNLLEFLKPESMEVDQVKDISFKVWYNRHGKKLFKDEVTFEDLNKEKNLKKLDKARDNYAKFRDLNIPKPKEVWFEFMKENNKAFNNQFGSKSIKDPEVNEAYLDYIKGDPSGVGKAYEKSSELTVGAEEVGPQYNEDGIEKGRGQLEEAYLIKRIKEILDTTKETTSLDVLGDIGIKIGHKTSKRISKDGFLGREHKVDLAAVYDNRVNSISELSLVAKKPLEDIQFKSTLEGGQIYNSVYGKDKTDNVIYIVPTIKDKITEVGELKPRQDFKEGDLVIVNETREKLIPEKVDWEDYEFDNEEIKLEVIRTGRMSYTELNDVYYKIPYTDAIKLNTIDKLKERLSNIYNKISSGKKPLPLDFKFIKTGTKAEMDYVNSVITDIKKLYYSDIYVKGKSDKEIQEGLSNISKNVNQKINDWSYMKKDILKKNKKNLLKLTDPNIEKKKEVIDNEINESLSKERNKDDLYNLYKVDKQGNLEHLNKATIKDINSLVKENIDETKSYQVIDSLYDERSKPENIFGDAPVIETIKPPKWDYKSDIITDELPITNELSFLKITDKGNELITIQGRDKIFFKNTVESDRAAGNNRGFGKPKIENTSYRFETVKSPDGSKEVHVEKYIIIDVISETREKELIASINKLKKRPKSNKKEISRLERDLKAELEWRDAIREKVDGLTIPTYEVDSLSDVSINDIDTIKGIRGHFFNREKGVTFSNNKKFNSSFFNRNILTEVESQTIRGINKTYKVIQDTLRAKRTPGYAGIFPKADPAFTDVLGMEDSIKKLTSSILKYEQKVNLEDVLVGLMFEEKNFVKPWKDKEVLVLVNKEQRGITKEFRDAVDELEGTDTVFIFPTGELSNIEIAMQEYIVNKGLKVERRAIEDRPIIKPKEEPIEGTPDVIKQQDEVLARASYVLYMGNPYKDLQSISEVSKVLKDAREAGTIVYSTNKAKKEQLKAIKAFFGDPETTRAAYKMPSLPLRLELKEGMRSVEEATRKIILASMRREFREEWYKWKQAAIDQYREELVNRFRQTGAFSDNKRNLAIAEQIVELKVKELEKQLKGIEDNILKWKGSQPITDKILIKTKKNILQNLYKDIAREKKDISAFNGYLKTGVLPSKKYGLVRDSILLMRKALGIPGHLQKAFITFVLVLRPAWYINNANEDHFKQFIIEKDLKSLAKSYSLTVKLYAKFGKLITKNALKDTANLKKILADDLKKQYKLGLISKEQFKLMTKQLEGDSFDALQILRAETGKEAKDVADLIDKQKDFIVINGVTITRSDIEYMLNSGVMETFTSASEAKLKKNIASDQRSGFGNVIAKASEYQDNLKFFASETERMRRGVVLLRILQKQTQDMVAGAVFDPTTGRSIIKDFFFDYRDLNRAGMLFRKIFPFFSYSYFSVVLYLKLLYKYEGIRAFNAGVALLEVWEANTQELSDEYKDRWAMQLGGKTYLVKIPLSAFEVVKLFQDPVGAIEKSVENPFKSLMGLSFGPFVGTAVEEITGKDYFTPSRIQLRKLGWSHDEIEEEIKKYNKEKKDESLIDKSWNLMSSIVPQASLINDLFFRADVGYEQTGNPLKSKKFRELTKFFGINIMTLTDVDKLRNKIYSMPPSVRNFYLDKIKKEDPELYDEFNRQSRIGFELNLYNEGKSPNEIRAAVMKRDVQTKYYEKEAEKNGSGDEWLRTNSQARDIMEEVWKSSPTNTRKEFKEKERQAKETQRMITEIIEETLPSNITEKNLRKYQALGAEYTEPINKEELIRDVTNKGLDVDQINNLITYKWKDKGVSLIRKDLLEHKKQELEQYRSLSLSEKEALSSEDKSYYTTKAVIDKYLPKEGDSEEEQKKAFEKYREAFNKYFTPEQKERYLASLPEAQRILREANEAYINAWGELLSGEGNGADYYDVFNAMPQWFKAFYFSAHPDAAIYYPLASERQKRFNEIYEKESQGFNMSKERKALNDWFWSNSAQVKAWERDKPDKIKYLRMQEKFMDSVDPDKYYSSLLKTDPWYLNEYFKKNPDAKKFAYILATLEEYMEDSDDEKYSKLLEEFANSEAGKLYAENHPIAGGHNKLEYRLMWNNLIKNSQPGEYYQGFYNQPDWFKRYWFNGNPEAEKYYGFRAELAKKEGAAYDEYLWADYNKEAREAWFNHKPEDRDYYTNFKKTLSTFRNTNNMFGYYDFILNPKNSKYLVRWSNNDPKKIKAAQYSKQYYALPAKTWEDQKARIAWIDNNKFLREWWDKDKTPEEIELSKKADIYRRMKYDIESIGSGSDYYMKWRELSAKREQYLKNNPDLNEYLNKSYEDNNLEPTNIQKKLAIYNKIKDDDKKREYLKENKDLSDYFLDGVPEGIRQIRKLQEKYFAITQDKYSNADDYYVARNRFLSKHRELQEYWDAMSLPPSAFIHKEKFDEWQKKLNKVLRYYDGVTSDSLNDSMRLSIQRINSYMGVENSPEAEWFCNKVYNAAMSKWIDLMGSNKSIGMFFFRQLPSWIRARYFEKNPNSKMLKGYSLGDWFATGISKYNSSNPGVKWALEQQKKYGAGGIPFSIKKQVERYLKGAGIWEDRSGWDSAKWNKWQISRAAYLNGLKEKDIENNPLIRKELYRAITGTIRPINPKVYNKKVRWEQVVDVSLTRL